MSTTNGVSKNSSSDVVRSASRFGEAGRAAARAAVTRTILAARAEGRSLVVKIDGEVRSVPAAELVTPEEAERQGVTTAAELVGA